MKYRYWHLNRFWVVANAKKIVCVLSFVILCAFSSSAFVPAAEIDDAPKLVKKAVKLTRAGVYGEAERILRSVLASDPSRADAKLQLAYVLVKQRRLGEAYELSFGVAKENPKNAHAFSVLGFTLLAGGRFADARTIFFQALNIDKREDLAWAGFGLVDFYENKIDNSLRNLQEAVYRQPNEPDYYFTLAQVSARAEQYNEAADAYTRFLAVSDTADEDRRARIRGLINFLRYLGQRDKLYQVAGAIQTSVPFELVGNRPVIDIKINNHPAPLKFVLDTGSGISVISDETAKRLKIKPITKGGHAKGIGGDGRFEVVYGFVRDASIGDVTLQNVPVYIRKFHSDAQQVDGYIGLSLISKFLTTIDYGSSQFTLTRRETDTKEFRENSALSLPLRLTSSGFLSGEVQLEGVESALNFIVDTGASVSVISDRMANTKEIHPFINDERLRVIGSAGVTENVPTYLLPRVTFGSHSRKKVVAVALDLDLINEASGFEQSGILGGNFLKNYRVTFDFKNSKVSFTSINPEQ